MRIAFIIATAIAFAADPPPKPVPMAEVLSLKIRLAQAELMNLEAQRQKIQAETTAAVHAACAAVKISAADCRYNLQASKDAPFGVLFAVTPVQTEEKPK